MMGWDEVDSHGNGLGWGRGQPERVGVGLKMICSSGLYYYFS